MRRQLIIIGIVAIVSAIVFVLVDIVFPSLDSDWDSNTGSIILVSGLSLIGLYKMVRRAKNRNTR